MVAKRKPGSNLGRAAIDWEAAFLSYASLPRDQRTYQAVADRFGVSVRTVERHGRNTQWARRAREIDQTAAQLATERLRDARAEALADTEKLIAASMLTYATQLRSGSVKMSPADIARLHKLRNEIWDQTDNSSIDEPSETSTADASTVNSPEYKLEFVRALFEAGLLQPPTETGPDNRGADNPDQEAA